MPRLSIPERHQVGVAGLGSLPPEAFADFLRALEKGLSADNVAELGAQLKKKIASLRRCSKLSEIIAAVAAMQGIYNVSHVGPDTFGKDVANALSCDAPKLASTINIKLLSERIVKISEAKQIDLAEEKIQSIRSEVEKAYCCGRILTDARAAFADDPSKLPTLMTILHTLRIGYHDDQGEHREFYIALDNDDLADLKEHIERAFVKSKTLEKLLAKANCRLSE